MRDLLRRMTLEEKAAQLIQNPIGRDTNPNNVGPDHPFSMNPKTWREMVDRSRELEQALGTGTKIVEANEQETVVVQRRALHAAHDIAAGAVLQAGDIEALRPAPAGAFLPYEEDLVVGRTAAHDMKRGAAIHPADLAPAERKEAPSC